MVFEGLVGLGIACLLAPAIAEFGKFRKNAEKGFNWLAVAGVFFLFGGSFASVGALSTYLGASIVLGLADLFSIIGWIFALIGTIFVGYEVLVER